ncbi:hypothetical protein [Paenibacillus sp. J45TS6]|uniref:hypothetical protein n=1 Tax=Paenibacillus sp. J45TS6 TaxID=2807196 RepID=UPI001BCDFA1F|nr:hypothetical protein [Paenibacillus sp. J45TS6]
MLNNDVEFSDGIGRQVKEETPLVSRKRKITRGGKQDEQIYRPRRQEIDRKCQSQRR